MSCVVAMVWVLGTPLYPTALTGGACGDRNGGGQRWPGMEMEKVAGNGGHQGWRQLQMEVVDGDGGDPGTAFASVLLLARVLAQPQSPWDEGAAHGHQLGPADVLAATLWAGGRSDSPRAVQAGRWQGWHSPRALGSGAPGASGPASAPAPAAQGLTRVCCSCRQLVTSLLTTPH